MWTNIARFVLKNRIPVLIVTGILTAFMSYQAAQLELDYEYPAMLPKSDSIYQQHEKFKEVFGADGTLLLIGVLDPDFFELEKFSAWKALGDSIAKLQGVENVLSVANAVDIVKNVEKGSFEAAKVFDFPIENQEALNQQAQNFAKLPFYKDLLYNDSTKAYYMAATISPEYILSQKREPMIDSLSAMAMQFGDDHDLEIHFSGIPYTRNYIALMVRKELYLFIFLAAVITALIIFLFFRSARVVFFSMLVVGISVIFALGSMNLMGYKITILTGMIPPLLIVIGIPNSVFLLNKYHAEFRCHGNKIKSLQRIICKVGNAILLTNLTTAAGFATFIITRSTVLVEFGIIASLNIILIFVLSICLIPIFFSFVPPPNSKNIKHLDNKYISKAVDILLHITQRHRVPMYMVVLILIVLAGIGVSKMKSTGYIVDDIPETHPVCVDLRFFEKHTRGVMPVEVSIDTRKRNGIMNLSTLRRIDRFQKNLEKYPELSRAMSITDGVKFARQAYFNGQEKQYRLPSPMEVNFLLNYLSKDTDKINSLQMFVDSTGQKARISIRAKDVGTLRMKELTDSIKLELSEVFPKDKYDTVVTGSSLIFTQGTSYLVRNLFASLGLAILLISLFMAWMFRSVRMVFISIIPNLLPLFFTAALMGYFNIAIKPSTILVFSVAFGISVDYAIHFLAKYRQELYSTGWDLKKSVLTAIKETGVSIIYTAIILFFGFGIFMASEFGGTQALGLLTSITLLVAMFANLILLPSLLLSMDKRVRRKSMKDPLFTILDEEEDIEPEQLKLEK